MIMKKIVYILTLLMVVFSACEPNEEIYEQLDEIKEPYHNTVDYTLTSNDYDNISELALEEASTSTDSTFAEFISDYSAMNEHYTAEDYVGLILPDLFPAYNKGSVANVTYNFFLNDIPDLSKIGDAEEYELTTADYDSMGEDYGEPGQYNNFSSSAPPEEYLPDFLATKFPNAVSGDVKLIIYKYYSGSVETRKDYYSFNGTYWEKIPNSYVLTPSDYDSMGAPGNYNNFSDDEPAEDYLPAFLEIKFPYAQNEDIKVVVYDYYDGSASTKAEVYVYEGGQWIIYDSIEERQGQFVHIGDGWIFDPTVRFTMSGSDYQIVVDYVETNISADYIDSYGTGEYYYGANSYYSNFDKRISQRLAYEPETFENLSEEESLELIDERVQEGIVIMLQNKYPDAVPQVGGFDVHYIVTYQTYNNDYSRSYPTVDYLCTEAASGSNPPQFELVEGPYAEEE